MDEIENAVAPEISAPEVETTEQPQPVAEQAPAVAPEESPQEKNWREARQTMKQLRRENQELMRQMQELQRAREAPAQQESVAEDDIVTEKRLNAKIKTLEERLRQKEADEALERLQLKYPDFDEVVNEDSIEYLKTNDPELADSLAQQKDPHKRAVAVYKMLKRSDYYANKEAMKEKARVQENAQKPVSTQAVRKQGVLAEANRFANGLTPELKKALVREMAEASKRS